MLYALGHPASFLVLLLSFVVGVTLHGAAQAWVSARMGDHQVRLQHRVSVNPRHQVDPFGAVGAAIGGLGWAAPVELSGYRDRRRSWVVGLVGPAVNVLFGVALLLLWRYTLSGGLSDALAGAFGVQDVGAGYFLQHGVSLAHDGVAVAVLLAGASQLYLGVLSLLPIPPLSGGRLLMALAPVTQGWQRARYHLVEQNIGLVVLLVLLVLPLGGRLLLLSVLNAVLAPLMRLILGV